MEGARADDLLRALLALLTLLALPGLTVVRAPWTAVPFLSLSFWLVTWFWLDALHSTRQRFVLGALAFFGLLALLRLPRLPRVRPGASTLLVVAGALSPLSLLACAWPLGDQGPLRALSVRLLAWRDGLPRTYEPLLPVRAFGADLHAVDLLAADITLLGDVPPALATLVASLTATGLLALAVFALLVRAGRRRDAALGVALLLSGASAASSGSDLVPGAGAPTTLGLALATLAAALLVRGTTRAPAVAAGLVGGAVCASDPWLAAFGLPLAATLALARRACLESAERPVEDVRLGLAFGLAAAFGLPAWLRLDFPRGDLLPLVVAAGHVAAAATLASAWAAGAGFPRRRSRPALALTAAIWLGGTLWGARQAVPRTPPSADDLRLFADVARRLAITDAQCLDRSSGLWMPAVTGRAVWPFPLPAAYPEPSPPSPRCVP